MKARNQQNFSMGLADVHAHLTHPDLRDDLATILAKADAAGVSTILVNGLNPQDNQAARELAQRYPQIQAAFGFYPVDAVLPEMRALGSDYPREGDECPAAEGLAWLEAHAAEAFAIGEIGLDGYWVPESLWESQENVFRKAVEIALAHDKAIIIHTRKRERRAFEILKEMGAARVDWHCFGGKVKLARQIAEHGHWLSIPANARRSESFTRMLETLPREKLLLETDCPYLSPDRTRRSGPADVAGTAAYAGELWNTSVEEVTARLTRNFEDLFGKTP
jgi:TatD DNase family protein